jgi:hypothetical protein
MNAAVDTTHEIIVTQPTMLLLLHNLEIQKSSVTYLEMKIMMEMLIAPTLTVTAKQHQDEYANLCENNHVMIYSTTMEMV